MFKLDDYNHENRYIDEVTTLKDFINLAYRTLNYWKTIHSDRKAWAAEWLMDDPLWVLKECPEIKNDYFTFDIKVAVLKEWAKNNVSLFSRCSICGAINESGYEDCNCDYEDIEHEQEDVELEDLIWWLEEIGIDENQITENDVISVMENEGFNIYWESVGPVFASNLEEVNDAINQIENAKNNIELIQAVLWSTHVMHVNGNVLEYYYEQICGDSHLHSWILSVQQDGLESVFDPEDIKSFMEEK